MNGKTRRLSRNEIKNQIEWRTHECMANNMRIGRQLNGIKNISQQHEYE